MNESYTELPNLSQSQNAPDEQVICPHCRGQYRRRGLARHIHCAHRNIPFPEPQANRENHDDQGHDFASQLFIRGFGTPLLNSIGSEEYNEWHARWICAMKLNGKQYILPQGSVGRLFVDILAKEIQAVPNGISSTEKIFIFCSTVLQKEKLIRNGSDIRRTLRKRMDMWNNNQYDELIQEAIRCDRQLKSTPKNKKNDDHKIRIFTRLVLQGKLREATRWITDRNGGGVLMPDDNLPNGKNVFEVLKNKYPCQMVPENDTFLKNDELPVMVDVDISSDHIEKMARCLQGSAGPSGTNADQWKSMILRFGAHSARLRESIASLTRWLSNGIVDWNVIRAFLARRGVALDKCPGVRPIGIGEVLQRLCAKTMAFVTGADIQEISGSDQLCAGTKCGIEAAIHAMSDLYDENEANGILLIDASNAFNSLSRPLTLWNARILWPRCARFLFNTYKGFAQIMFKGSNKIILSQEGTTQGDPLGMFMYAVGILPLIKKLKNPNYKQNWYADDSACCGDINKIREWLDNLLIEGPKWGYLPEPQKSILIVKPEFREIAEEAFRDLQVKVVTSHRFLGGIIGSPEEKENFVKEKIKGWIDCVKKLGLAALKSPQAAFTAFSKSLQNEWGFLQRVNEGFDEIYEDLKMAIHQYFTPNLFEQEISELEHELFTLPTRFGGLNIQDPIKNAIESYAKSRQCTELLTYAIKTGNHFNNNDHIAKVQAVRRQIKITNENLAINNSKRILLLLPEAQRRPLNRIIDGNSSQWLTVIPLAADHMDLSPDQFRDALTIRYGRTLRRLPTNCDGCDCKMDLTHALNCKKGGLVKHGHDQLRDHCTAIANMAWKGIEIEPVLREADPANNITALQADFKINGIWEAERVAFFDNRIINADAPSYANQNWETISRHSANEKHKKYDRSAEDIRGSFTPLICSTEGVIHKEYAAFQRKTGETLAMKWNKPYSQIIGWLRIQNQFAVIRAISLRIRGTRRRIRSLPFEDGAAMPLFEI